MAIKDSRLIQLALEALEEKRRAIDDEISQLRARMGAAGREAAGAGNGRRRRRKRKPMSAAQKRAVSERMKKYWADRRKGKK